jgi:hypothetical protein
MKPVFVITFLRGYFSNASIPEFLGAPDAALEKDCRFAA